MLVADYITANKATFEKMAAIGIISKATMTYYERYQIYNQRGRSLCKVAAELGIPITTLAYGNQRMEKRIVTNNLN